MKVVQINTVANGSTGTIMRLEHEGYLQEGDDSYICWGRGSIRPKDEHEFYFGSELECKLHSTAVRLDGRTGFHSKRATAQLIKKLDQIDPDLVHLHNLHGSYINVEMLFEWLAKRDQQTQWTLHDCWAFTGHCTHFTYAKCDGWVHECDVHPCPELGSYPKTYSKKSVEWNYQNKKRLFTLLPKDKMEIITPSQWLADLVGKSFLSKYPVRVVHNTINTNVFKLTPSDFRERYGIGNRFMILGVASPWSERKGLQDFMRLAHELDDNYAVVLVGLSPEQIESAEKGVVALPRVDSPEELAQIYTAADVHVQPSIEETFGMTVVEAQACGTPVIVREGSACEEAASGGEAYVIGLDFASLKSTIIRCGGCLLLMFERTDSQPQLAAIYSAADVFFNPTREDNYPTVNLEAEACETPVMTYGAGGSGETIRSEKSAVVDYEQFLQYVKSRAGQHRAMSVG